MALLVLCTTPRSQQDQQPRAPQPDVASLAPLQLEDAGDAAPAVAGWTFESIGYAQDTGRRRVLRVGAEGHAEIASPERDEGIVLRGIAETARGDLVSDPVALAPFREVDVEVRYRVVSGRPLVFAALRPTEDRRLVDLEFLPRARRTRSATVRLHSGAHQGPYSIALSIAGEGRVQLLSVRAEEVGDYQRPEGPLCVVDIRSADPDRAPHPNFARVASVFGFPSVEYLHYSEYTREKLEAIDPALVILPGLASSKGLDRVAMDRAALDASNFGAPVVGVCLGHQVLARALGAELGRASEWGPTEIEVVRRDPLFEGLPRGPRFFASESHNYQVERPIGDAQIIASSEACKTQVFRYRDRPCYTFQGHIERAWEVEAPEAVLLWKNMLRGWGVIPAR